MKKMYFRGTILLLSGLAAILATAPAQAGSIGLPGLYATASIGRTEADIDGLDGFDVDDTDTGLSIGLGYEFNKYFAVEAGYLDLGKATATASGTATGTYYGVPFSATGTITADAEADGFYFGPQFSLPLSEKFDILARIGLFSWDVDATATASGTLTYGGVTYPASATASASDDGTDPYFGLGVSYDLTDTVTVEADWTRYNDVADSDIDYIAAGVVFKFGKLL